MTPEQLARVDALFQELLEASAEERNSALEAEPDAEVREEAASLLAHVGLDTKAIRNSIGELMEAAGSSGAFGERTVGPGTRFERYRIERRLGHGGMGDVYEAVRENDFHKRVALKIVRYGLDSDFARSRFQQERQTLAGLEHPYIARLLDGGEAANGCPYLVLEFVDGVPVDVFCKGRSRDEVLGLFLKVCEAVAYAHRNLVIHRDLKPANILVTAEGEPKLLDFGIAKLLDPSAEATLTGMAAMTPQYASPEQVLNKTITTASDVYSLGVILYQLLTGHRPYELDGATALETERTVCLTEPPPPGLGNDLDDILLMALRKEPERRYRDVLEFARDIERFQQGLPVSAAPDSFRYRAGKFVGRNRVALAAVTAVILSLAGGLGAAIYQKRSAEAQKRIAEARFNDVRSLATTFLFDIQDKIRPLPGSTDARELVVTTALKYLDKLSKEAGGDTDLLWELQQAYSRVGDVQGDVSGPSLGHTEEATKSYRHSVEIGERLRAAKKAPLKSLDTLGAVYAKLGWIDTTTGNPREAVPLFHQCLAVIDETRAQDHDAYKLSTRCLNGMASAQEAAGDSQGALESTAKALSEEEAGAKAHPSIENPRALSVLHNQLGADMGNRGDLQGALGQYRISMGIMTGMLEKEQELLAAGYGFNRYQRTAAYSFAGMGGMTGNPAMPNLGDRHGAMSFYDKALSLLEAVVAKDPKDVGGRRTLLEMYNECGPLLTATDRVRATAMYAKAIAIAEDFAASDPKNSAYKALLAEAYFHNAELLAEEGRRGDAERYLRQSLQLQLSLPQRDSDSVTAKYLLARTLLAIRDSASLARALILGEDLWKQHPQNIRTAWVLADAYEAKGDALRQAGDAAGASGWYARSRDLWAGWPQHGVSTGFDQGHERHAAELASKGPEIARLSH